MEANLKVDIRQGDAGIVVHEHILPPHHEDPAGSHAQRYRRDLADGPAVFEATVNSVEDVASWVVSRGEGMTVLEPQKLREMVVGVAKGALRNYEGGGRGDV